MKIHLLCRTLIALFISTSIQLFGQIEDYMQESRFRPFSILILSPDSAQVVDNLRQLIDTVELEYRNSYYSYLKELEIWGKIYHDEKRRETEMAIQRAKWMELDIYEFKYYQTISMFSLVELLFLFNEYPWEYPSLTAEIFETRDLFTYDKNQLANHYDFDYIVSFKNISAQLQGNKPILKLTTTIYSRAKSQIIFEKETFGYPGHYKNKYGETMECSNDLQCLLETGAKSSAQEVFRVLGRLQKK